MNFSSKHYSWFQLLVYEDQMLFLLYDINEHHQSILVGPNKLFKDMHWDLKIDI